MYIVLMSTISLSDARRDLPTLINQAQDGAITISRHGAPAAVLISPSRYEELMNSLEDLEDLRAIDEAMKDPAPNIPWELVKQELGLA